MASTEDEGYPKIDDPEHPLYAQARAGWPNHTPQQAWRAAFDSLPRRRKANSADAPGFADDYIKNPLAERPEDIIPRDGEDSETTRR